MHTITKLAHLELDDWQGRPTPLADLWRDQTVVLTFIRHFG